MTLRANYLRAFIKTFLSFFAFIFIALFAAPYLAGKPVQWGEILSGAMMAGTLFGGVAMIAFTPREIIYSDDKISIKPLLGNIRSLRGISSRHGVLTAEVSSC